MSTSSIFFFFILCLSCAPHLLTSTPTHHHPHRRILHQPFFPQDPIPPTESPSPQSPPPTQSTEPKFPFSSLTPPNTPFFPDYPSPPPPPSSTSTSSPTTFPANISALIFPQPPRKKPITPKIVAIAVILSLFSAAFILSLVVLLVYCKKRRSFRNPKTSRSDSHRLFPSNATVSDEAPKVRHLSAVSARPTSSEFLYLGTLVNSHGIDGGGDGGSSNNVGSAASSSPYQKLGSPELHPLPPLARTTNFNSREFANVAASTGTGTSGGGGGEDEDEEFYSPRGSSAEKDSLGFNGSGSKMAFAASAVEKFHSRSSNSTSPSYPTSNSASPTNSISNSPSPPCSFSSRSLKSKSRDSVLLPPPPPPPPPRRKPPSPSPSPPSSPPLTDLQKNPHSLETISNVFNQNQIGNGVLGHSGSNPPPHPPPPPPPGFWETLVSPLQIHEQEISRPPVLITPSRPVLFQNPTSAELSQKSESVERSEETPKLKLKPLHWDKVRASSDRAMVWDQLKSSSFQ